MNLALFLKMLCLNEIVLLSGQLGTGRDLPMREPCVNYARTMSDIRKPFRKPGARGGGNNVQQVKREFLFFHAPLQPGEFRPTTPARDNIFRVN